MPASSPCPEPTPSALELIATLLKLCTRAQLQALLHDRQQRLGSPAECPGDLDCVQLIAHQLNNVLTAERVEAALRRMDAGERP